VGGKKKHNWLWLLLLILVIIFLMISCRKEFSSIDSNNSLINSIQLSVDEQFVNGFLRIEFREPAVNAINLNDRIQWVSIKSDGQVLALKEISDGKYQIKRIKLSNTDLSTLKEVFVPEAPRWMGDILGPGPNEILHFHSADSSFPTWLQNYMNDPDSQKTFFKLYELVDQHISLVNGKIAIWTYCNFNMLTPSVEIYFANYNTLSNLLPMLKQALDLLANMRTKLDKLSWSNNEFEASKLLRCVTPQFTGLES